MLIALLSLIILSCSKENNKQAQPKDCTSNFQEHPKAIACQALLDKYTNDGFAGISILIDSPTDGLWMGSSGFANLESNKKMNACNTHHTASLYKTYTATIIMQLVEEDKINLDDKLASYLSSDITDSVPNGNKVSIRNLLQHRSGIPDIFEEEFVNDFFGNPTRAYTIHELLAYIYDKEPLSDVDTQFHYSDANYSLLTLVIENVESNYAEAIRSRIFDPLKLTNTYFLEDPSQAPASLADSYWDSNGDNILENNSIIQTALTAGLTGSDGIVTTALDLKTFIQALAKGELVKDLNAMTDFLEVPDEVQQTEVYKG